MLLIEVLIYVIIAMIAIRYICKEDWLTVLKIGIIVYIGWLLLCILCI